MRSFTAGSLVRKPGQRLLTCWSDASRLAEKCPCQFLVASARFRFSIITNRQPGAVTRSRRLARCIRSASGSVIPRSRSRSPSLSDAEISTDGSTSVRVSVTNTGPVKADEVVQMYIRDKISSVTRPVMELKGFQRVSLEPGETKTIELAITPDALQFYNLDMQRVVEPGEFEIMVGASSVSHKSTTLTVR